jgi:hypothetical protein
MNDVEINLTLESAAAATRAADAALLEQDDIPRALGETLFALFAMIDVVDALLARRASRVPEPSIN